MSEQLTLYTAKVRRLSPGIHYPNTYIYDILDLSLCTEGD